MRIDSYLHFNGNCAEAFRFYKDLFGATELRMQTWGKSPMAAQMPAERQDEIMHAHLALGSYALMGSDAGGMYQTPAGFRVAIEPDSAAEAERIFAGLSEGGVVMMPLGETFWAQRFGMLTDRFGTPWMVNYGQPTAA